MANNPCPWNGLDKEQAGILADCILDAAFIIERLGRLPGHGYLEQTKAHVQRAIATMRKRAEEPGPLTLMQGGRR